jgi:hypothetical protein
MTTHRQSLDTDYTTLILLRPHPSTSFGRETYGLLYPIGTAEWQGYHSGGSNVYNVVEKVGS